MDHGDLEEIKRAAKMLAKYLNIPIWMAS